MVNINIRDTVYQAIEEYNNTVKRPHCQKFTDTEKNGLFYTIIRRYFSNIASSAKQRGRRICINDFKCTFKENGELKTFKIMKSFYHTWYQSIDEETTRKLIECIKEIGETHKEFYRTPVMNEIAHIVNQI